MHKTHTQKKHPSKTKVFYSFSRRNCNSLTVKQIKSKMRRKKKETNSLFFIQFTPPSSLHDSRFILDPELGSAQFINELQKSRLFIKSLFGARRSMVQWRSRLNIYQSKSISFWERMKMIESIFLWISQLHVFNKHRIASIICMMSVHLCICHLPNINLSLSLISLSLLTQNNFSWNHDKLPHAETY